MGDDVLPIDQYISQEIVNIVQKLPKVLDSKIPSHNEIKVACISLGYKNGEILKLLDKRGDFLGVGKFQEATEMDKQILKLLETKMNDITTPVSAFVTFTTQEAHERCSKYLFKYNELGYKNNDRKEVEILGQKANICDAPDPTNVIWEHLGISGNELMWRKI